MVVPLFISPLQLVSEIFAFLHNISVFEAKSSALTDYGLLFPCLRFTHTVACIGAKIDSDAQQTLSSWLLNQLDSQDPPDFAYRTKNSLCGGLNILKGKFLVKRIYHKILSLFANPFRGK
jgi:hypothetical protein